MKKTTEQFIKDAKLIHGDKYDYSLVEYINNNTKVNIKCNRCGKIFPQKPNNHLRGQGCSNCNKYKRESLTTEQFIEKAKLIHGDKYDYSLVEYVNGKTPVKIICKEHGEFFQKPHNHLNKYGCKKCGSILKKEKCKKNSHRLTTEQFIEKAKLIHGDKYDYSLVEYINYETKVNIKCNKCGNIFLQKPNNHLQGQGCNYCNGSSLLTTEEFIERAKLVHGDKYDYSLVKYINYETKVNIKCNKCNRVFSQTPDHHLAGSGCNYCISSRGEERIRLFLKERNINFEIQKTYPNLKDKKSLSYDFYIPSKNLLIEYNGIQHYKFIPYLQKSYKNFLLQKHHDWLKRKYARDKKINLLVVPYKDNLTEILNGIFL